MQNEGVDFSLKLILSFSLSLAFAVIGILRVEAQKKKTRALEEAVEFIAGIRNELRFKNSDYSAICEYVEKGGFRFLKLENGEIALSSLAGEESSLLFSEFSKKIGTTDCDGQLSICDEYKERLQLSLDGQRKREKEKVQVDASVSLLGAVCSFIFFL